MANQPPVVPAPPPTVDDLPDPTVTSAPQPEPAPTTAPAPPAAAPTTAPAPPAPPAPPASTTTRPTPKAPDTPPYSGIYPQQYCNCATMHYDGYLWGVGRPGAWESNGDQGFTVDAMLYNVNVKLDHDRDCVVCEQTD